MEASTLKAEQLKHYAIVTIALADFEYKTSNNLSLKMEPALYRQYIFDAKLQFFKEYNHIISNCRTVPAGLRKNIDEVFAKLERML